MKILYILNVAPKVNNFSYTSMIAAQNLQFEYHIAGNWSYKDKIERDEDEKKNKIHIHHIDFHRIPYHPKNLIAYKQLMYLVQKENFDIIHCNTPIGGLLGRIIGEKVKTRYIIYQAHGFHFYKGAPLINWLLYYPIEKWLARYTDILITINKEDYEVSKSLKLKKNGKCFCVSGVGININYKIMDKKTRTETRKSLGISEDAVVLISVGELNKNKNHKIIIQALAELKNSNLYFIICGDGNKRSELEDISRKLSIRENIIFMGYCNEVEKLYAASDIFVLPSIREGLSRSLMEAMVVGLPCIVSNIRGNKDLIKEGEQGYLCNPNIVSEFKEKISLLSENKDFRERMSFSSKEKIKEFDSHNVIQQIESIYELVVSNIN